jgi:phosphate transport system substrate-binding protein
VMVHAQNDWVECLTVEELRRMWEAGSQINRWSQVRAGFPDRPLNLYGPGTDSGTYDYFTAAIVGQEGASRPDFTASEDDNVLVQGVAGDPNALGFFGLAYYEENRSRLRLLAIDDGDPANGAGCIQPTMETVRDGTYRPLSRPEFIYVAAESAGRPEIDAFVDFYMQHGGQLAQEVGYAPLSNEAYRLATERYRQRTTGSVFGGHGHGSQVGVRVEDLLLMQQGAAR